MITGSGAFGESPQPYRAFVHQLEASAKFDCTDRLGGISAPTLIMRGDGDALAPKDLVERSTPGSRARGSWSSREATPSSSGRTRSSRRAFGSSSRAWVSRS